MRADELKRQYGLEKHIEGGWFAEYYTAPFKADGRPLAGSIYFLLDRGERAAAVIPKGAAFAAENLSDDGFTFVSCVTTPAFEYEGFRLLNAAEIKEKYGDIASETEYLAYEEG